MQSIFSVNEGTNNNCFNTLSSEIKPYDPDTPTFTLKNAKLPEEIWNNTDYPLANRTKLIENKESGSRIPRPLNSYFIYNKHAHTKQKYMKMAAEKIPVGVINKLIGEDWENEPEEVKYIFECGAEVAKKEHAKKHKDYKFKRNQKKGNKKKDVGKNKSTASTTSLPSSEQRTKNNSQIFIPTMEESDVSIPDTPTTEESYQSDVSIPLDSDIPEQLSDSVFSPTTSVNDSQELADLYQFENTESNSPIIEELQFDENIIINSNSPQSSNSFFSPTTSPPISTESIHFTMPVDSFSQYHSSSLEFMGNQPSNYPSNQAVSNIVGFGPPGYLNCDQNDYPNIQPESNIGPAYDFLVYPNSLIESSVYSGLNNPYIPPEFNEPYGSIGFNNLSGLVIDVPQCNQITELICNQIAELICNQIAELTYNRITELTYNRIAELTYNRIAELACNQITELTCNRIAELTFNRITELTYNRIAELTYNRITELTYNRIAELTCNKMTE